MFYEIKQLYEELEPEYRGELNEILITDNMDSLLDNVKELALRRSNIRTVISNDEISENL